MQFPKIIPQGDAPLRYRDQLFTSVAESPGITYGSAKNLSNQTVTLKLDMYEPPSSDTITRRPAIIWVHGGSFCCGDKTATEITDEANHFAMEGYVSASINYRLEPGGCTASSLTQTCISAIKEAREDAQTAVRFLRTNAATYGIDPTRIAIAGTSAGAITALEVGYSTAENPTSAVRAAVSLSGANILSTIGAGDAPALLFHGTLDTIVPYQWAVNTVNAAKAAGLDVFLESWDGAGHAPCAVPRPDPHSDDELPVVGDESRARREVTTTVLTDITSSDERHHPRTRRAGHSDRRDGAPSNRRASSRRPRTRDSTPRGSDRALRLTYRPPGPVALSGPRNGP